MLLCQWESLVKKMANFHNHVRITPKCIKTGVTPVSCKLSNTIKIPRRYEIIKKVEKQLLNETVNRCGFKMKTLNNRIKDVLDRETLQECWPFIYRMS